VHAFSIPEHHVELVSQKSDLKRELQERGLSTTAFIERAELVTKLAQARKRSPRVRSAYVRPPSEINSFLQKRNISSDATSPTSGLVLELKRSGLSVESFIERAEFMTALAESRDQKRYFNFDL